MPLSFKHLHLIPSDFFKIVQRIPFTAPLQKKLPKSKTYLNLKPRMQLEIQESNYFFNLFHFGHLLGH